MREPSERSGGAPVALASGASTGWLHGAPDNLRLQRATDHRRADAPARRIGRAYFRAAFALACVPCPREPRRYGTSRFRRASPETVGSPTRRYLEPAIRGHARQKITGLVEPMEV